MSEYTTEELAERRQARARIKDQQLVCREFEQGGYHCEMEIWNDNNSHIKFGYRSMFGWIYARKGDESAKKLGFSVTVPLNDWDLSPRYVEFGLLGKLDDFIRQQEAK